MNDDEKNYQAHEHFANGNSYHSNGRFKDAISEYKKAIELNPIVPVYHYGLGNSYAMTQDFNQAINEFTEALRLNPTYEQAKRNLDMCIQEKNANVNYINNGVDINNLKQLEDSILERTGENKRNQYTAKDIIKKIFSFAILILVAIFILWMWSK